MKGGFQMRRIIDWICVKWNAVYIKYTSVYLQRVTQYILVKKDQLGLIRKEKLL